MPYKKIQKIMFNELQKLEYIEYESTNRQTLTNYFKRLAESEMACQKDVAEMDGDQLKESLSSLKIRSEEARGHLLSLLRGYVRWAVLNGKAKDDVAINHISPRSIGVGDAITAHMIQSPGQLQMILENAMDFVDYENRSKRNALAIWLLYDGLDIKDLPPLKKGSMDYDARIITAPDGKQYKTNESVASLWRHCAQMRYLEKRSSQNTRVAPKIQEEYLKIDLSENDYLFRAPAGSNGDGKEEFSVESLRQLVFHVFSAYSENTKKTIRVSPLNLKISGMFYNLYEYESAGGVVTPEIIAERKGISYVDRTELFSKTRKWRIEYENWKAAFGHETV